MNAKTTMGIGQVVRHRVLVPRSGVRIPHPQPSISIMEDFFGSLFCYAILMSLKKFRWSQVYESSEEELVAFLQARKIENERVHAEAGTEQTEQYAERIITIWCAEGSLVIKTGSTSISLQPGDALRIKTNTMYAVRPGIADCTYYLTN
jgi:heat shock protein HspQ